jgi:SAM-dependent methyltransferase
MTLHPLATRFVEVADAYERGRPDYPPAVAGVIAAELRLAPGDRVLDLAAGTGKLTRALLAVGIDVLAIEPQAQLREILARAVGSERARDGLAEAIPLAPESVAAVTVADAFHWFDHARALAEIRRVVRPGGGLAVLSTLPDWTGASWGHEVGSLMSESRPNHPWFDGPRWRDAVSEAGCFTQAREIRLTFSQPASPERLLDYVASVSWVAAMPEAERGALVERIGAIIAAGETPAELPMQVLIGLTNLA